MADHKLKLAASSFLLSLATTIGLSPAWAAQEYELRTISSRPDTVSGGDVLVQVRAPTQSKWAVELNARDVTKSFHAVEDSGQMVALLTGLKLGRNKLELLVHGAIKSTLTILNHSIAGPIFSGVHQTPFICQTDENGLGPALDADCSAKTVVQYFYKSTTLADKSELTADGEASGIKSEQIPPGLRIYHTGGPAPSDVAVTLTTDGQTVPYIVRRETGVINRAVYDIQFLHVPGQPLPTPWTRPTPGWNGRLIYIFGSGCAAGYRQGTRGALWLPPGGIGVLAPGYAIATSTLNTGGNSCNDKVSAETVSMVKEHFIKEFGVPVHTIGDGGSGGSIQQHLIAQNYPGLLDGIIVWNSFPDIATYFSTVSDCTLLDRAFNHSSQHWTAAQKTAVSGFATWHTCSQSVNWKVLVPTNCDHVIANGTIPKELVYDPKSNPRGARCDYYDNEINVFGPDPHTGFARRPLDNIGVQYGLIAFNSGKISAEQFIDLNREIGGFDADGNFAVARMATDPESLRIAYESGVVNTGGGGLGQIPIIDSHVYTDNIGDNHDHIQALITRARLIAANGNADNQVILVYPPMLDDNSDTSPAVDLAKQMDVWLDHIRSDNASGTVIQKISRNRPAGLKEGCVAVSGEVIDEKATLDGASRG